MLCMILYVNKQKNTIRDGGSTALYTALFTLFTLFTLSTLFTLFTLFPLFTLFTL